VNHFASRDDHLAMTLYAMLLGFLGWSAWTLQESAPVKPRVAQRGEHLEPDLPLLSAQGDDYDLVIRDRFVGTEKVPFLRILTTPSFDAEWAIHIREPHGDTARVELLVAETNLNYCKDRAAVKVRKTMGEVSTPVAELLRDAWLAMLRQTRYPLPQNWNGHDGTTYHFASHERGLGELNGQVWSPPEDSPTGQLVALATRLRALVEARTIDRPPIEQDLRTRANALLTRLRK
jgi:hypothetical protein